MQAALKRVLKPAMRQSLLSAQKSESWESKVNDGVAEEGKGREEKGTSRLLNNPELECLKCKMVDKKTQPHRAVRIQ